MSLIDVLEQLNVTSEVGEQPPYALPIPITVVSSWFVAETMAEEMSYRISVVDPDDRTLGSIENSFSQSAKGRRKRTNVGFADIEVFREGYHYVHVAWRAAPGSEYEVVAKLPLDVRVQIET